MGGYREWLWMNIFIAILYISIKYLVKFLPNIEQFLSTTKIPPPNDPLPNKLTTKTYKQNHKKVFGLLALKCLLSKNFSGNFTIFRRFSMFILFSLNNLFVLETRIPRNFEFIN